MVKPPEKKLIRYLRIGYNLLLYLSVIFLIIYLFSIDYVDLKSLTINLPLLLLSFAILFICMLLGGNSWSEALRVHHLQVPYSAALASHGLSIFAKYIPGKIWVVLGRAVYISRLNRPVTGSSFVSTKLQITNMAIGMLYGIAPLMVLDRAQGARPFIALLVVLVIVLISSQRVQNWAVGMVSKTLKRAVDLPSASMWGTLWVIFLQILQWGLYSISYYLLVKSLYPQVNWLTGFAFALAVNFALVAIVVPGGIGVRETAMVGYLVLVGVPVAVAVTISLAARIWFTLGEVFLFISGVVADRRVKRSHSPHQGVDISIPQ